MRFYFSDNSQDWDQFLLSAGPQQAEWLQSFAWGNIMKADGWQAIRLYGVNEEQNYLVASSLYARRLLGKINYWYCPRGPFIPLKICQRLNFSKAEAWRLVLSSWQREGRRAKTMFIRFEPGLLSEEEGKLSQDEGQLAIWQTAKSLNLRLFPSQDIQPAKTLILDLSLGQEAILAGMKSKTRYNLNLAKKHGLTVSFDASEFSAFWRLLKNTGERDGFRLHDRRHYKNILKLGGDQVKLISVKQGNKVLAAGIFSFFGKKAVYLHGASDYHKRALMAPYLLQWTAIEYALKESYRYYDFHGIDEKKWPGVTRFKQGFGGQVVVYPGAFDLVIYPGLYFAYQLMRHWRVEVRRYLGKIKKLLKK